MAPITGLYGALCGLLLLGLAVYVMINRGRHKVGLGDGGNPDMLRAIRIHANAVEYVPIALIVMLLYELQRGLPLALHVAGICLVVGRLLHAWGIAHSSNESFGRAVGTIGAFLAILIPSIGLLLKTAGIY